MKKVFVFLISIQISLGLTIGSFARQPSGDPEVLQPVFYFKSKPIRELTVILPGEYEKPPRIVSHKAPEYSGDYRDHAYPAQRPVIQKNQGPRQSRGPVLNFAGVGNLNGFSPADPNGDVGLDHYVQIVNMSLGIWDKSGNMLYGPVDYKTIWGSFPGPWNDYYWVDPVVKYDQLADRWVITSISYYGSSYYTMIAVSTTPDPMGSYHCYAYLHTFINDYPKISIWPDGYYLSYHCWQGDDYLYPAAAVVDRCVMLEGGPQPSMILFALDVPVEGYFFPLPADLRGNTVQPGEPCYFVIPQRFSTDNPLMHSLNIYAFETDWTVPANSSFNLVSSYEIGEYPFYAVYGPGAPQPDDTVNIMVIPWFLMYPLTYRVFDDHETMVCCHTVWDGEAYFLKWYELRKETNEWYIYQSGNYAPGDAHYYFPSISVNANGDIALGYSISSPDIYPSVRYTGRLADDSLGLMTFQEIELFKGLNYANTYLHSFGLNRWGDYSSMMVDPADDTTFWYTNMYTRAVASPGNWDTRIFSFNLTQDTAWPYAFAGNDTVVPYVVFFTTQGEAENYSSIIWTTGGDGNFVSNNSEQAIYQRGPGDLANGQVTLTMHLTGYYPGTEAADSMVLYLKDTLIQVRELCSPEMNLEIFPNPARDIVTVRADLPSDAPVELKIISGSGREIFTGRYLPVNRHLEVQFDLRYLPAGVYFVKLRAKGEGQRAVRKILLLH